MLGYHHVIDDLRHVSGPLMPGLAISVPSLARQLDYVGRRCRFVPLEDLARGIASGSRPQRPCVAVTFDDGYSNNYEHAFPLLARKGIPATFFVVTDLIDTESPPPHDILYAALMRILLARTTNRQAMSQAYTLTHTLLRVLPPESLTHLLAVLGTESNNGVDSQRAQSMTWEMLRKLRAAGMSIGSHARTHLILTARSKKAIWEEVNGSKEALERGLDVPVTLFAYPYGAFDVDVIRAVADAGYRFAFTTCTHRAYHAPHLTMSRTMLWEGATADRWGRFSQAITSCLINGVLDRFNDCSSRHVGIANPGRPTYGLFGRDG